MKKLNYPFLTTIFLALFSVPALYAQYTNVATDYWRTKNTGDWATPAIWESSPDGTTWYDVSNGLVPDSTATNVLIQHNISISTAITLGKGSLNAGTTTTLATTGFITLAKKKTLTVNGTIENQNPSTTSFANSALTTISFGAGSTYLLSAVCTSTTGNTGMVPTGTYNTTSNISITGVTTSTGIAGLSGLTMGNLTYNCPNQTATTVCSVGGWSASTVNGTFTIASTGAGKLSLSSTKYIVNTYNQTGGTVAICAVSSGTGNRILQVNGNFNLEKTTASSSTFYFTNATVTSANIKGYLQLLGDMNVGSGATIAAIVGTQAGNHYRCIMFCGTSAQTVTFNGTKTGVISDTITNNTSVTLATNYTATGRLALMKGTLALSTNTLSYSGSSIFCSAGVINATTGTINFTNTIAVTIPASAVSGSIANLSVNGAGGVILGANTTISNALTLTSGLVTLGANNLTIASGATLSGGSSASYIVTDGTGVLACNAPAQTLTYLPVGASASSYDPAQLTPTEASNLTVNVGTTLPATAPNGYTYNNKVWTITSKTPSETALSLTPSSDISTQVRDIIGIFANNDYSNEAAAKSTSTYTATVSTFGQFVTGTSSLSTENINTKAEKFSLYSHHGMLTISNATGVVSICNVAGETIQQQINDSFSIALKPGIYIVRVGNDVRKVII